MEIYILSLQDWETLVSFFEIRNGFYVIIIKRVPMSHQGKKVLIVFVVIVDQSANQVYGVWRFKSYKYVNMNIHSIEYFLIENDSGI